MISKYSMCWFWVFKGQGRHTKSTIKPHSKNSLQQACTYTNTTRSQHIISLSYEHSKYSKHTCWCFLIRRMSLLAGGATRKFVALPNMHEVLICADQNLLKYVPLGHWPVWICIAMTCWRSILTKMEVHNIPQQPPSKSIVRTMFNNLSLSNLNLFSWHWILFNCIVILPDCDLSTFFVQVQSDLPKLQR